MSAAAQSNPAAPPATRPAGRHWAARPGDAAFAVAEQFAAFLAVAAATLAAAGPRAAPNAARLAAAGQGDPNPGGAGPLGEPSGTTTPPAQVGNTPRGGNLMGTPTGAARTLAVAPATLSLPEAMTIGLENNLTTLLATERASEARALRQQVRSFLLPNTIGTAYQQNRTLNLVAQGLVPSGSQDITGAGIGGGTGGAAHSVVRGAIQYV